MHVYVYYATNRVSVLPQIRDILMEGEVPYYFTHVRQL